METYGVRLPRAEFRRALPLCAILLIAASQAPAQTTISSIANVVSLSAFSGSDQSSNGGQECSPSDFANQSGIGGRRNWMRTFLNRRAQSPRDCDPSARKGGPTP